MAENQEYNCLEVNDYPGKESIAMITKFLEGLRKIAEAQNESSDGAGFDWKLKIEAEGKWI